MYRNNTNNVSIEHNVQHISHVAEVNETNTQVTEWYSSDINSLQVSEVNLHKTPNIILTTHKIEVYKICMD